MATRSTVRTLVFLAVSQAFVYSVHAQDARVAGMVIAPDGRPAGNVILAFENGRGKRFTTSEPDGSFSEEIPDDFISSTMAIVWQTGVETGRMKISNAHLIGGEQIAVYLTRSLEPPPIRFHHFSVDELAASVLLNGFVPPEINEYSLLRGKAFVIARTPAYDFGAGILRQYGHNIVSESIESRDIQGGVSITNAYEDGMSYLMKAFGSAENIEDHFRTLWTGDPREREIFVPDYRALEIIDDNRLPDYYRYRFFSISNEFDGLFTLPPVMVRDLEWDDVALYREHRDKLAEIRGQSTVAVKEFAEEDQSAEFRSIDELEPLLAMFPDKKFPEGFIQVKLNFSLEGCAIAAWWFAATARVMKVEMIVVENISDRPVDIGAFYGELRHSDQTAVPFAEHIFPQHQLGPAEAIIVPVAIRMVHGEQWGSWSGMDEVPYLSPGDRELLSSDPDRLVYFSPEAPTVFFSCSAREVVDASLLESTSLPEEVAVGPSLALEGVELNGSRVPIREATRNVASVSGLLEGGSCPFFLTQDPSTSAWINHGPILVGAVGIESLRSETILLKAGVSQIRVMEQEMETAHVVDIKLNDVSVMQNISARRTAVSIGQDEYIEVDLSTFANFKEGEPNVVEITGYYVPF